MRRKKKVRAYELCVHDLRHQKFSGMIGAIDRQVAFFGFIGKNDLIEHFKSGLYFLFRSLALFNLLHFFYQVRKHSVTKTLEKKFDFGKTANSAHVKCLYIRIMP